MECVLKVHGRILFPLLVLAVSGLAAPAQAQIYAGVDRTTGAVVLSNFQTGDTPDVVINAPQPAPVVVAPTSVSVGFAPDPKRVQSVEPVIQKVAQETAVSPQLLHAVIEVESGYDPKAVSRKGAQGLMQLTPQTAQRFGVRNAFDPLENVRGGALYLKWLLEFFDGDLRLALAGYNAGEIAVVRAGYRIPQINETLSYVPKVLSRLGKPVPG